jgi:hypothetical protein
MTPLQAVYRGLAVGLVALLPAAAASAQARPGAAGTQLAKPAAPAATPGLTVFHDGHGLVTVMADHATREEVLALLSKWFGLPKLTPQGRPDARGPIRFDRVPVAQVVDRLLRGDDRGRPAVRTAPLAAVHDGRGLVTMVGEEANLRDVMRLLSKWFAFPILNLEAIPEARTPVRFECVPVTQVVDRLMRGVYLNYVMLTNPVTSFPTKVVAAPAAAAAVTAGGSPQGAGRASPATLIPSLSGSGDMPPGAVGGYPYPFPAINSSGQPMPPGMEGVMPVPQSPNDPMPIYQLMPPIAPPGSASPTPAPVTPGAARPGVLVPGQAPVPPPTKPPGAPDQ